MNIVNEKKLKYNDMYLGYITITYGSDSVYAGFGIRDGDRGPDRTGTRKSINSLKKNEAGGAEL